MQFKETCVKCCVLASFPADDGWEHGTARCLCRSEDKKRAFGISCSATGTSEVKLRRGWPLRGQQVSRIKWRLLRTSLGINSTLHRGGRSLVSRSLYDTSLHPSRLSSVALLLHSMSDETNTSGRKSCQSPHADESTTLLKTKNTLRFATTTPWFVGSWYVWSEQWCPFFLCPCIEGRNLRPMRRIPFLTPPCCVNSPRTVSQWLAQHRKWKRKNEKRKANSICESEKRKGHGKGYNFMIHMTWETRVQEDGCAYEHQKRPRAKALRDTFASSGVGALIAPRWWTLQEQLSITQEQEFLSKNPLHVARPSVAQEHRPATQFAAKLGLGDSLVESVSQARRTLPLAYGPCSRQQCRQEN